MDASVLIAWLDPQDGHHHSVLSDLHEAAREQWAISALTLAEVMTRAAADEELLAAVGEAVADLELVVVPLGDEDAEALARLRAASGLRMPDCCVLLVASTLGGRVLSTDTQLVRRAGELGLDARLL
nr:PIN domain-containing protein [Ornithinimicrobium sp. F0845]